MSGISSSEKVDKVAEAKFPGHEHEGRPTSFPLSRRRRRLLAVLTATCVCLFLQFAYARNVFRMLSLTRVDQHPTIDFHCPGSFSRDFTTEYCLQENDWSPAQVWSPDPTSPGSIAPQFHSFATLDIPITSVDLTAVTLIFRSRYPGTFRMTTSPQQPKDVITFNVSSIHHNPASKSRSLDSARICVMSFKNRSIGVGISNPQETLCETASNIKRRSQFDTTLILPESSYDSIPLLTFYSFTSEVVGTTQIIGDIGTKIFFKYVYLLGIYEQPIEVESLSADQIFVRSMGGPIRGTFNSAAGVALTTSNSPILAEVNLNSSKSGLNSGFFMSTTNSPIKAAISLFSGPQNNPRPSFLISTYTTNSPINLSFKTAPLDSVLQVKAGTTNSPATVNVHPTFEGSFNLKTTIMEPEINEDPRIVDPSGKGRSRNFQYSLIDPGQISGKVYWGEESSPPQPPYLLREITISTTNSPAILNL